MASTEQPKKAKTAYFLWLDEHRAEITKEVGTAKGSVVTKAAGEKWKALSAEVKKPFEERAAALKTEYEAALQMFKDGGGEVIRKSKKEKKEKRAKKANKDPNAPKRPVGGSYGIFLAENREEIKKGLPAGFKITDVAKAAGEKWKVVPESEKKVYKEKFKAASEKYAIALAEYKAAGGSGDDEADKVVASPPAKRQSRKRTADESGKKEPKAKRGRPSKGGSATDTVKIDEDVLEAAQKLNMEGSLKNLAARSEIAALNLPSKKILEALQKSEGLVNQAKHALLGA